MASIVRIKRRPSQEPAEALLLAAKRMKVDDDLGSGSNVVEENVFRFCGTTENEKENVENIAKLVEKGKLMSHRQPLKAFRSSSHTKLQPSDLAASNSEKKYKVLNALRNIDTAENTLKIYDLVLEREGQKPDVPTCNGVPLVVEKSEVPTVAEPEEKYVYDFYYSDRGVIDDTYIDSLMSVQPYYFHPEEHEDSDVDDSDDSNDENNWRNDYPDTESDDEYDEDLAAQMGDMRFTDRDGYDYLSSGDEDLIYSLDDKDAFTKFKERIKEELIRGTIGIVNSDDDDDEDDAS